MRKLANLFFILFILMSISGLLSGLVTHYGGPVFVHSVHTTLHLLTLISALIVYIGCAFNRHLPKTLLFPLMLWLFWGLCGFWPFHGSSPAVLTLVTSAVQLLCGLLILRINSRINRTGLLLTSRQFAGRTFDAGNLLRFIIVNIVVVPLALVVLVFFGLGQLVDGKSGGFVQLKADGLYMKERTYRQGDKEIRLAAMIHLGQRDYYTDLKDSLPTHSSLLLAEGVQDSENRLSGNFSYGKLAGALGLVSQENLRLPGELISPEQLRNPDAGQLNQLNILAADIDLKEFDPRTIEVLNTLAREVLASDQPLRGYTRFNSWVQQQMPADIDTIIMHDLIDKRNAMVLGYLTEALAHYDHIVIPWGALHMPGIEQRIRQLGFELSSEHERKSIDFLLLPYGQIWQNLTGSY